MLCRIDSGARGDQIEGRMDTFSNNLTAMRIDINRLLDGEEKRSGILDRLSKLEKLDKLDEIADLLRGMRGSNF